MSFFNTINISASGLTAQRMRMDIISQNIANADTTIGENGMPYRRRQVLFQEIGNNKGFSALLKSKMGINQPNFATKGVRVLAVVDDNSDNPMIYDPSHPHANADGYVARPNVNPVLEMVNMISASRSYEANITAINSARAMINRTLELASR
jgi:flagellar basal-body rod protein FlgC